MSQKTFKTTIEEFKEANALLNIQNSETVFEIPIQNLPENSHKGGILTVKIFTSESEELENQNIAKAMLEELLN